jgi:hypothetical protein
MKVFDLIGNEIDMPVNQNYPAGSHQVELDAGKLSAGMYIYKIQTAGHTATRQILVTN